MKRLLLTAAFVVLLAAAGTGVALLTGPVGDRRVTPFPSSPGATASPNPAGQQLKIMSWWPVYGYDLAHTRASSVSTLEPPFTVRWTFYVGELLEFPPVVWSNRLYFTSGKGIVHCVEARTGEVVWTFPMPGKAASTPAVSGRRVFATSMHEESSLYALDRDSGLLLWTFPIGAPSESSPVVWNGMVIFGSWDGCVYAVREDTGELVWRFQTGGRVHSTPAICDGHVVFGSYDGCVYCLDAEGRLNWRFQARHMFFRRDRFYTTPTVAYRTVYIGSVIGTLYAIDLYTGNLRWSRTVGDSIYSSAAAWDGQVFFGSFDTSFYALDAETGSVRWTFSDGERISGAPAVINRLVYFSTFGKHTYAADVSTGQIVWEFGDGRYSPATTWGDMLILVGSKTLYGLDELR